MTAREVAERQLEHVRWRVAVVASTLEDVAETPDQGLRKIPAEAARQFLTAAVAELSDYVAALTSAPVR